MSNHTLATELSGTTRFAHLVTAVVETPEDSTASDVVIVQFEAICQPASAPPVLFVLRDDATSDGPSLQIEPDRVSSLNWTVHRHTQDNKTPPSIHLVRRHLGERQNLVRLHFRLYLRGDIVGPAGPVVQDAHAKELDGGGALGQLAVASAFSLYLPDTALRKSEYNVFYNALKPFLRRAPEQPQLPQPVQQEDISPAIQEYAAYTPPAYDSENEDPASRPPASGASTVAVSTPVGFSPGDDADPDNAYKGKANQEHESDDNLPEYPPEGAGSSSVTKDTPRKRHYSSSGHLSPSRAATKRARPADSHAFAEAAASFPPLKDPACLWRELSDRLQRQDERIAQLALENRHLKLVNREYARRLDALEDRTSELDEQLGELGTQHDAMGEHLDLIQIQTNEMDEECRRVAEEWAETQDIVTEDRLALFQDIVDEKMAEFLTRLRSRMSDALRPDL